MSGFEVRFWTVITVIIFVPIWAFFLAPTLAYWGAQVVSMNSMTGLEALFWNNLNLLVFVVLVIFVLLSGTMGGDN